MALGRDTIEQLEGLNDPRADEAHSFFGETRDKLRPKRLSLLESPPLAIHFRGQAQYGRFFL